MYKITLITTGDVYTINTITDVVFFIYDIYRPEEVSCDTVINLLKIFNEEIEWFETEREGLLIERTEAE